MRMSTAACTSHHEAGRTATKRKTKEYRRVRQRIKKMINGQERTKEGIQKRIGRMV